MVQALWADFKDLSREQMKKRWPEIILEYKTRDHVAPFLACGYVHCAARSMTMQLILTVILFIGQETERIHLDLLR